MKGLVIATVCWTVALSPFLFAALAGRRVFLWFSGVFGALCAAIWVSSTWFGFGLTENLTSSLDGHIYIYRVGVSFGRGDLIAYRWHGGATYPAGEIFIKPVVGMPGDLVRRAGTAFWVGEQYIGVAKSQSKAGVPLTPAAAGAVPAGEYFVATPHPDSLDSRYALSGNIKNAEIIGRAYAVF